MSKTLKAAYRLQPLVYQLSDTFQVEHPLYFLVLPNNIREALINLSGKVSESLLNKIKTSRDKATYISVPIASLNSALLAIFPEIITTESYAIKEGNNWLVAERPIQKDYLQDVVKAWMLTEFHKVQNLPLFLETLDLIESEDWSWVERSVDLRNHDVYENGTARLESNFFAALPDYICQRLSQEGVHFSFGGEDRALYRTAKDEVISWPPFEYKTSNEKRYYYSIALKFSVETMPHEPQPLILMTAGTKRFVSQSLIRDNGSFALPWDRKTSVLLNIPPYWKNSGLQAFGQANLEISQDHKRITWSNKLEEILARLSWHARLPETTELALNPQEFLMGKNGSSLAIVHNNANLRRHPVGSGTGLTDKEALFQQVAKLIPILKPLRCLERVRKGIGANFLVKSWDKVPPEQRRKSISEVTGGEIGIEIFYETEPVRQELKKKVVEVFGFDNANGEGNLYQSPELNLYITETPIGDLGQKLEIIKGKKVHNAVRDAIYNRMSQVEQQLNKAVIPTGSLIELVGGKGDFLEKEDPKRSLRKGFARTGRINQFIIGENSAQPKNIRGNKDTLGIRAENAVLDLLRQFGYLPESFSFKMPGKHFRDEPLDIFAFWLIRSNKNSQKKANLLPIILHMQSGSRQIKVRYPQSQGWQSYAKALLSLGQMDFSVDSKFNDHDIANFILKVWQEDIVTSYNSLVLVDGVNIRSKWKWLMDKMIDPSRVWITDKNLGWNRSDLPGTRIVRIRASDEVPYGFGSTEDGSLGLTSGVFAINQNLFYAIAPKPTTMLKYGKNTARTRRTERPDLDHKQPGLVEIFPVLLQPNDDPATWASLVHKMRRMLPTYDDYATHPLPLHLLKKAEEYLSAIDK